MKIQAAIARGASKPFSIEEVNLDDPREDEVIVRIKAVGLCHTDIFMRDLDLPMPAVFGHEGSGIVEKTGGKVTKVKPGDKVVLSYGSCGVCPSCTADAPYYCHAAHKQNTAGARPDGSPTITQDGEPLFASFFYQSSFGTYALANERNVVKVREDAPLEELGPMGCGFQTGAGSVLNGLRPKEGSSLAVFGTGSVGLSALMAAKVAGCGTIIAVDLNDDRLALSRELGATHTVNPNEGDPVKQIQEVTGKGVDYALECTGNPAVIRQAIEALGPRGTCGWVGLAPIGSEVSFDSNMAMNKGVTIKGLIEGESHIDEFIPQLIDLYMSGQFPIDRLIKFYNFDEINDAERDHGSGATIKAILRMPE